MSLHCPLNLIACTVCDCEQFSLELLSTSVEIHVLSMKTVDSEVCKLSKVTEVTGTLFLKRHIDIEFIKCNFLKHLSTNSNQNSNMPFSQQTF